MSNELRIGFDDEPMTDVLQAVENLISKTDMSKIAVLAIGHQKYLGLEEKKKIEEPPIWNLLKQINPQHLERIDFHFHFMITSHKEEFKFDKAKQRLQTLVAKLAEKLQRKIVDDSTQVSIDGTTKRTEEPMQTQVDGCASIFFTKN